MRASDGSAAAGGRSLIDDLSPAEATGLLRSLMANVPGAIYRVALEDGLSLRLIGGEIERITGYQAEDFIDGAARTLFPIVHPEDRQWIEVELRAAREQAPTALEAALGARRSQPARRGHDGAGDRPGRRHAAD